MGIVLPTIGCPSEVGTALNHHTGKACFLTLKVKYKKEKKWVYQRIWMVPGWIQADVWRRAYTWVSKEARVLHYNATEIEEMRFDNFKLV